MSVEFDEEKKFNSAYSQSVSSAPEGLTSWLIKKNIVKSETGAKGLMLVIILLCFGLTIFLFTN